MNLTKALNLLFIFTVIISMQNLAMGKEAKMKFLKNTPIMVVESVNSAMTFWTEHMNFTKTAVFPDVGEPAFAILNKDSEEIMFQTKASFVSEHPILEPHLSIGSIIQYIDVSSLKTVLEHIKRDAILVPARDTFYGTREVIIKEPSGFLVIFAEKKSLK